MVSAFIAVIWYLVGILLMCGMKRQIICVIVLNLESEDHNYRIDLTTLYNNNWPGHISSIQTLAKLITDFQHMCTTSEQDYGCSFTS